jgi:hypothetical protein
MRRAVSMLCCLALANLVLSSAGWACAHLPSAPADTGVTAGQAHEHHMASEEDAAPVSDRSTPSNHCLTTAHCISVLMAMDEAPGATAPDHPQVAASSDLLPRSAAVLPELPPPRS